MSDEIVRFFAKSPDTQPLYDAVEQKLLELPGVWSDVQKSQITFRARLESSECEAGLIGNRQKQRAFAWVWLPIRPVKNRPAVYIVLSFGLDRRIDSPRIVESVMPYSNRWTHHVIIEKPANLDDELIGWLKLAHDFACRR